MGDRRGDVEASFSRELLDSLRQARERGTQGRFASRVRSVSSLYLADILHTDAESRTRAEKYGAPILQGKRSHFIGVLGTEARLLGVKIRYETEVTGYSDSSESPAVILAGGEIVRADVVIVCDGARSVSRTLLAEANIPPTPRRPSGYSIYRAIINAGPIREDPICRREFPIFM